MRTKGRVTMTEEERKEITHLLCGAVDGNFCSGPEGLFYDGEEFCCRYHGNGCSRVGEKSGRLKKNYPLGSELKTSLVRKKLKVLCAYLKEHPEKISSRYVCECGNRSYNRCLICSTVICTNCQVNMDAGNSCGVCRRCSQNENSLKVMKELIRKIEQLTDETRQLQRRRTDEMKLWKQKVWSGQ